MPDKLFVLDVIQHWFINLSNLLLTEKQKSVEGRGGVLFQQIPHRLSAKGYFSAYT